MSTFQKIPADLLSEIAAESSGTWNLIVPEGTIRSNGRARWPEIMEVESATQEIKVAASGFTHTVYLLKAKVVPAGDTVNGGKNFFSRNHVNYESLTEREPYGQFVMSKISLTFIAKLMISLGIDPTPENMDEHLPILFSEGSPLKEMKFKVSITDNDKRQDNNGENEQEITALEKIDG